MDYRHDYYTGLAGIYFRKVLSIIIGMGNLSKENGTILDFGCGVSHLKKSLPGKKVIGYDLIKELSDIDDYTKLNPSVIVCNAVLEHLDISELKQTINNFRAMNKNAKLIVALPTENILSKIGMFLTGNCSAHEDHKLKLEEINSYLSGLCERLEMKKVFAMTEVSMWRFR